MFLLRSKSRHWSVDSGKRALRKLASDCVPYQPDDLIPVINKETLPWGDLVNTALPAVLEHQSEFLYLLRDFVSQDLRQRISSEDFELKLANKLNRFSQLADLPNVGRCKLINGMISGNYYNPGRYSFADGSLNFHYRFDPDNFIATVAHEFTHLEQDYLAICRLADFLEIGSSVEAAALDRLCELINVNRAIVPSNELVERFLRHRNGRRLSGAKKARAEAILSAMRLQPYYKTLVADVQRAEDLLPKWSFFSRIDYEGFWQTVSDRSAELPLGLLPKYKEALDYMQHEKLEAKKSQVARNFYLLMYYYKKEAESTAGLIYRIWQLHCFFEREAYAVSRSYAGS